MIDSHPSPLPSNRKFGWLFAVAFGLLAAHAEWVSHSAWAAPLLGAAIVFAALTAFFPESLTPFNRFWFQLGEIMGKIVSPVVLGIIFFFLVTPVAAIARLAGRDPLNMKKRSVTSYWIERHPNGPQPDSYKNQF